MNYSNLTSNLLIHENSFRGFNQTSNDRIDGQQAQRNHFCLLSDFLCSHLLSSLRAPSTSTNNLILTRHFFMTLIGSFFRCWRRKFEKPQNYLKLIALEKGVSEDSFPMSHGGDVPISLAPIDLSFEKYSPRSRDKEAETQGNVQVISIIADGSDEIIGLLTS